MRDLQGKRYLTVRAVVGCVVIMYCLIGNGKNLMAGAALPAVVRPNNTTVTPPVVVPVVLVPGKLGDCCWASGCAQVCEGSLRCSTARGVNGVDRICSAPVLNVGQHCTTTAGPATLSSGTQVDTAVTGKANVKLFGGTGTSLEVNTTTSKSWAWSLSRIGTDAEIMAACGSNCPQSGITGWVQSSCSVSISAKKGYSIGWEIPLVGGAGIEVSATGTISRSLTLQPNLEFKPTCPGRLLQVIAAEELEKVKSAVCTTLLADILKTAVLRKK